MLRLCLDADVATDACFTQHGNCRKTLFSQRCPSRYETKHQIRIITVHINGAIVVGLVGFGCRDQSCGTLFCSGGWNFPVTSKKSYYTVGNGDICNEAAMNPEDNYPTDLGMVPTGTKCGHNMVRKLLISLLAVSISKPLWRPASVSSHCISGVLQSTVSRHQKHKNIRDKQLLCQMQ